jgi:hypothetical protein
MLGRKTKGMVFASALAAVGFAWQRPAQACSSSLPPCVEVPPEGATFPANAVAFRLFQNSGFEDSLKLRTEDGSVLVPASVKTLATGERVFSPDGPLEPGRRYVLRYDRGSFCQNGVSGPREVAFLTTEALTFPPSAGTLNVVAQGVMNSTDPGMRFGFVKLQLVDTPESQPFRALRSYRVEVDDRAFSIYGIVAGDGRYTLGTSPEILIPSVCAGSEWLRGVCSELYAVPAGRHRVKVIPHILGAPSSVAPLEEEIEVSCDDSSIMSSPAPLPPSPASAQETGTGPESPAACSFVAGHGSGGPGLVLGLVTMVWLGRRRPRVVAPSAKP